MGEIVDMFLGPNMRGHVSLKGIQEGKLIFSADSSGAIYNFRLYREKLLREIKKEFPGIKELSIKTGNS